MSLIGSDFVEVVNPYTRYCSECHRKVLKGEKILASIRNGVVHKYVCSEECRQQFDNAFWQEAARKRETGQRKDLRRFRIPRKAR